VGRRLRQQCARLLLPLLPCAASAPRPQTDATGGGGAAVKLEPRPLRGPQSGFAIRHELPRAARRSRRCRNVIAHLSVNPNCQGSRRPRRARQRDAAAAALSAPCWAERRWPSSSSSSGSSGSNNSGPTSAASLPRALRRSSAATSRGATGPATTGPASEPRAPQRAIRSRLACHGSSRLINEIAPTTASPGDVPARTAACWAPAHRPGPNPKVFLTRPPHPGCGKSTCALFGS
jgi:hypothetical protein